MMHPHEIDIAQYEADFEDLGVYEERAELDLTLVECLDEWKPTSYERFYLPSLRLAGIGEKQTAILQNAADLHVHTQWSDGDDLDAVLDHALTLGLDALAITDHDEIEGALEARRRVHRFRLPIAVVPGCEVSSRDGHIGALFVTKKFPTDLSAEETVEMIHEAGGIAVAHHPYTPRLFEKLIRVKLGCGDLIRTVPFDAIECTNAVPGFGVKYNIAAVDAMREQHIKVAVTGSSDAHVAQFVGKGQTYYAGNEGIVSLRRSLEYGFTRGAEEYWKTREKVHYFSRLAMGLVAGIFRKGGSVN